MPFRSAEIQFGGQTLLLDSSGALYWPARRILVVSDMHLEKATFLATHGSFIPPYDTLDTLERLEQLVLHYTPQHLILLGDSFHDRQAWIRLDDTLKARLTSIVSHVKRCSWIEGNHDVSLTEHALTFCAEEWVEGMLFSHEHRIETAPQIIGHYHPKATISVRGRHLSGKCFLHTERVLVMPAFGAYTGGLDIHHQAFAALTRGDAVQLYLLSKGGIHRLPSRV